VTYQSGGLCSGTVYESFYVATDGCYGGYSFYLAIDDLTLVQKEWVEANCTGAVAYSLIGSANGVCAGGRTISRYVRPSSFLNPPQRTNSSNITTGSALHWHDCDVLGTSGNGRPTQFVMPFGEGPRFCNRMLTFGYSELTARVTGNYMITFGQSQCLSTSGFITYNYTRCLNFAGGSPFNHYFGKSDIFQRFTARVH
jgi:hypothetical protein